MSEFNNQATKTATYTQDISYAELDGANRGQRPDLLAREQGIYRTPDGKLYSVQGTQLLAANNILTALQVNPLSGPVLLAGTGPLVTRHLTLYQSATPVITPLDTVNNVVLSVVVPGGLMGPNGRLMLRMMWSYLNNANTKTIKARFGGAAFCYNTGLGSQAGANIVVDILNRGMTNVQLLTPLNVNSTLTALGQPWGIGNIDTTIDQLLTIEIQKAVGTDTAVLEAAILEVF